VAVKVGDVNGSYFLSRAMGERIEPRNSTDYELDMQLNPSIQPGGDKIQITVPIGQGEIDGLQFSLYIGQLTPDQVKRIHSDLLDSDEWNYDYSGGTLNVSWSSTKTEDISGKMILSIPEVNTNIQKIEIESFYIKPEAYKLEDENYSIRKVRLKVFDGQETKMDEYHLYQNVPNPFVEGTVISFNLPQQEKVRLIIYDSGGKQVFEYSSLMAAGYNEIPVKANSLKHSGIYYYTLYTSNASFTRKMSFTND
jgi:hypothetical protein